MLKNAGKYILNNIPLLIVIGAFLTYHFFFSGPKLNELKKENKDLRAENKRIDGKIDSVGTVYSRDSATRVLVAQQQDQIAEDRRMMREDLHRFTMGLLTFQKQYAQNPTYRGLSIDSLWRIFNGRFDHP